VVQSVGNQQDDDDQAIGWLLLCGGTPEGIGSALHELTSPRLPPASARIDDPVCQIVYELKPIVETGQPGLGIRLVYFALNVL
jgi:hypothetical protein